MLQSYVTLGKGSTSVCTGSGMEITKTDTNFAYQLRESIKKLS